IGLVFQDFALFPHLTIRQNVAFGLRSFSREETQTAVARALGRVGLAHYGDKYPHMLSGGEQQRVALARAIAPRPAILLMDEPFSGLDKRLRDSVRTETLALLKETRTTAIFVTHDPEEAMRVGDRIALMRAGQVVQIDTPGRIYTHPTDLPAARFFSEINEIPAIVSHGHAETPLGNFAVNGAAAGEGDPVVVCARPQAVRLGETQSSVDGRIIGRQFLGELDVMEIAVTGLDKPLIARIPAGHHTGSRDVRVWLDPDTVMVFAADDP
ncbi:MAG: ABC transporter ATP-binding protein, partial [Rhodobiaceae bacterium]|nr:ABC transporter ATP-binding protein [Rhodobiaceae bacterium]